MRPRCEPHPVLANMRPANKRLPVDRDNSIAIAGVTPPDTKLGGVFVVDGTRYVRFRCGSCKEITVERVGSAAVSDRECSDCFSVPALEDALLTGVDDGR